jgi:hypothetical protein
MVGKPRGIGLKRQFRLHLAGAECLGATGQFGETRQAAFDFRIETDG